MTAFANPNKPAGLSPVQSLIGADWTQKANWYCIPSSDSTYNYMVGDLVALTSGGGDSNGTPYIAQCAAGAAAIGVIVGVGLAQSIAGILPFGGPPINPNNLAQVYAPIAKAGQNYYALVIDDPNVIFEIQEGSSVATTNLTQSSVSLNANIAIGANATAATPVGFLSNTYLDNHTAPTTTAAFNLRIVRFAPRLDNRFTTVPSTGGGFQKWWVKINNHYYSNGVTAP